MDHAMKNKLDEFEERIRDLELPGNIAMLHKAMGKPDTSIEGRLKSIEAWKLDLSMRVTRTQKYVIEKIEEIKKEISAASHPED